MWLIFLTMAIRSAGAGIQMPAVSALIPQITPMRNLMRVNGINGSIQSAMALLAPAAAGAIYAWSSASTGGSAASLVPIFFIDVVTASIGIGLLALIPVAAVRRAGDVQTGYFADLVDGVRYVAHHAFVRWLLVLFAIIFVLIGRALQPHAPDARALVRRGRAAERRESRGAGDRVQHRHGARRHRRRRAVRQAQPHRA